MRDLFADDAKHSPAMDGYLRRCQTDRFIKLDCNWRGCLKPYMRMRSWSCVGNVRPGRLWIRANALLAHSFHTYNFAIGCEIAHFRRSACGLAVAPTAAIYRLLLQNATTSTGARRILWQSACSELPPFSARVIAMTGARRLVFAGLPDRHEKALVPTSLAA